MPSFTTLSAKRKRVAGRRISDELPLTAVHCTVCSHGSYLLSPDVVTSFTLFNRFLTRGTFSQESPPCRTRKRLPCVRRCYPVCGKRGNGAQTASTLPANSSLAAWRYRRLDVVSMSNAGRAASARARCANVKLRSLRLVAITWTAARSHLERYAARGTKKRIFKKS